ncbi:MAG: cytochrome c-type biogenesis protein CcmH [Anaerolineales bacterium]|nr:cytochrome c-type biogenesis protein CcmH [Anaerolineales bacterium]
MKRYPLISLLVLILALGITGTVLAQDVRPTDDEVNAIAKQLYCPVCENTPLDVCPTEACREWREQIRAMLAEGKSEEEIKQFFVEYYGARVLSEPPRQGFNWVIYIVPPLVILAGAGILFMGLRKWVTPDDPGHDRGAKEAPGTADEENEYLARIEKELLGKD